MVEQMILRIWFYYIKILNNTMNYQEKLNELFFNRIVLNSAGQETVSFGNIGANVNEIESLGINYITKIPNDYIEFLKSWNGCTLFDLLESAGFTFFCYKSY
jgi:hypothetical protein